MWTEDFAYGIAGDSRFVQNAILVIEVLRSHSHIVLCDLISTFTPPILILYIMVVLTFAFCFITSLR